MKHYDSYKKEDRAGRMPLRTITELAEEFGVTRDTLVRFLSYSDTAPSKILKTGTSIGASRKNTWYNPTEVRAWWKQFLIDRPDVRERLGK